MLNGSRFSLAKPNTLAGPLFMLLSACWFTVMNVLLKQATADFGVWDIGFYRFCGGLIIPKPLRAAESRFFQYWDI